MSEPMGRFTAVGAIGRGLDEAPVLRQGLGLTWLIAAFGAGGCRGCAKNADLDVIPGMKDSGIPDHPGERGQPTGHNSTSRCHAFRNHNAKALATQVGGAVNGR